MTEKTSKMTGERHKTDLKTDLKQTKVNESHLHAARVEHRLVL